mmetsp:Transcript_103/g.155  ORF Transcript_103/g.155 Transcript_103/m.155 type:complete len:249 (-) Transcript_103:704-1450(-)
MGYGFYKELSSKYADPDPIFEMCKKVFACLPLSAVVENTTMVVHGGLFRSPRHAIPKSRKKAAKRKASEITDDTLHLGTLKLLRAASKGGSDPDETKPSHVIASDVLWSDPQSEPGLAPNDNRGVGLLFGPDVTDEFLKENKLRLIIRSHEGPDSRIYRDDMKSLLGGYAVDHEGKHGCLLTVFSAPDYPMFAEEDERTFNLAAFVVLRGPDFATPEFKQFEAANRPAVTAFSDSEDGDESEEEGVDE